MYIEAEKCRKARVIRDIVQANGTIKRETLIDGIACRFTDLGVFIYSPKEQNPPVWAEWFPNESKNGTKTIVYL